MSRTYRAPEPLTDDHDVACFECRSSEQTDWLRRYGRVPASERSTSRRARLITWLPADDSTAVALARRGDTAVPTRPAQLRIIRLTKLELVVGDRQRIDIHDDGAEVAVPSASRAVSL